MNRQYPTLLSGLVIVCAVALPLASCSNKKDKAEIESLKQELLDRDASLNSMRTSNEDLARTNAELTTKVNEADHKAGALQSQLDEVKANLESLRDAKANEAAQTRTQAPARTTDAAKAQLAKQLAAVVRIEGDVTSGCGTVVQADGKTWLYTVPQVLSGNAKFSIKSADGAAIGKFGAFQIAPDANLVRLEIQQEMPVKFEVDSSAAIEATTRLTAVSAGSAGTDAGAGAPQVNECHASRTVGNDLEIESSALQQSGGCPVLGADSVKVIAIIASANPPPTLWPGGQAAAGSDSNTRAARLNRAIDWKPATLAGFLGERRKIEDFNRTTRLLYAVAAVKVGGESLQLDGPLGGSAGGATTTVLKVLEQNAALPMVAELMKIKTDLADKKMRSSVRDIDRRIGSILSQAKSAGTRQIQDMKSAAFSPCHRPAAELALKWRGEADQALTTAINAIGR